MYNNMFLMKQYIVTDEKVKPVLLTENPLWHQRNITTSQQSKKGIHLLSNEDFSCDTVMFQLIILSFKL